MEVIIGAKAWIATVTVEAVSASITEVSPTLWLTMIFTMQLTIILLNQGIHYYSVHTLMTPTHINSTINQNIPTYPSGLRSLV
jgi:uncharacterized membrane protein